MNGLIRFITPLFLRQYKLDQVQGIPKLLLRSQPFTRHFQWFLKLFNFLMIRFTNFLNNYLQSNVFYSFLQVLLKNKCVYYDIELTG